MQAVRVVTGPYDPPDRVLQALARALADPAHRAVVLDLHRVNPACGNRTLDTVTSWLAEQPVDTVPAAHLLTDTATRLLHGGTP